jgi:hypothetical protein
MIKSSLLLSAGGTNLEQTPVQTFGAQHPLESPAQTRPSARQNVVGSIFVAGNMVGVSVGPSDGWSVGNEEGWSVGSLDGDLDGDLDGAGEDGIDGDIEGASEVGIEGDNVGESDGLLE